MHATQSRANTYETVNEIKKMKANICQIKTVIFFNTSFLADAAALGFVGGNFFLFIHLFIQF